MRTDGTMLISVHYRRRRCRRFLACGSASGLNADNGTIHELSNTLIQGENSYEHDYDHRRTTDLRQRLGSHDGAADRVPPWLAAELRLRGHPDALLRRQGVSRRRP